MYKGARDPRMFKKRCPTGLIKW